MSQEENTDTFSSHSKTPFGKAYEILSSQHPNLHMCHGLSLNVLLFKTTLPHASFKMKELAEAKYHKA